MAVLAPARWPGSSTFPGTDQYPGQGDYPIYRFLMSFDAFRNPSPTWVDLTPYARSFTINRGRPDELQAFDAGSASVTFDNRARIFGPAPGATYANDVMNRLWIYAEYSGVIYDRFKGYVEAWIHDWDDSGIYDATATARCVDEFKILTNALLPASGTYTGLESEQVQKILDAVGSHASRRILVTVAGDVTSITTLAGQSAFEAISRLVLLEGTDAAFFTDRGGALVFLNKGHRSVSPWNTAQIYFADQGVGLSYPYLDCQIDQSDTYLFNYWTATDDGGSATSSDIASIDTYGPRPGSISTSGVTGWAGARVGELIGKYKSPFTRIITVTPDMTNTDEVALVLDRELMDKVRISRNPIGGASALDQSAWIQKIEESGQPNAVGPGIIPSISFGVSPL
jgi:hypothetical protein